MSRRGERPSPEALATLPVAVDAMGGDKAPGEIVEGRAPGRRGARDPGRARGAARAGGRHAGTRAGRLQRGHRHGRGPRRRRAAQEGLVAGAGGRARARREGLGHGLGRQHRGDHGRRPCCAWAACPGSSAPASPRRCPASAARRRSWSTPAPIPSARPPCWCSSPRWAPPTSPPASGTESPTVGLLSIGEEPTKGTPLVKETHGLLVEEAARGHGFDFVGNLEGRDLLPSPADVIVTDGFTGNVTLKALEGSLRFLFDTMLGVFGTDDATREAAGGPAAAPASAGSRVRAREHGRGHAARHRRRLRHQPRVLERDRP